MRVRSAMWLAVVSVAFGLAGCEGSPVGPGDFLDLSASRGAVHYWGHSTFSITSSSGQVLLIDPYNPTQTGYPRYQVEADVVLISHEHYDHIDTSWTVNSPTVVRGLDASGEVAAIDQSYGEFRVRTIPARHYSDPADADRGNTAIFVIEVDGVRLVHLGDLGQTDLDENQLAAIGEPDFLMIPVGGTWTIDGPQACAISNLIGASYVLPMHYRTADTASPLAEQLATRDPFVDCFVSNPVSHDSNGITLNYAGQAIGTTLLLLDYK